MVEAANKNGIHPVEKGEKTFEEVAKDNKKSTRPSRASIRRAAKDGRTPTGVKLSKAAIAGIAMTTQKRDGIIQQLQQVMSDLAELYASEGLSSSNDYFIDEQGYAFITAKQDNPALP